MSLKINNIRPGKKQETYQKKRVAGGIMARSAPLNDFHEDDKSSTH
jgi:hypothetical protein